ncbi:MAG: UDP-N-acetylmuramoyl-tripeptide--D-alanyl-D-alanine ligase [Leptolyngbya sp. SIO1D8]|nr:UDP-N-acetylmuramoyl-tripeptide--D-alanyl-D-alanine ligase [Leptolyngbya sp. SIO1D8]
MVLAFDVSLQRLAQITDATLKIPSDVNPAQMFALGISTDTRLLKPQHMFLALRGENFDGHNFVSQAITQKALGVIVDDPAIEGMPQLLVKNTLAAYQAIAHWWRQHLGTPLVAITGSVGKTTTKELVAAVLSSTQGAVLKTQANYNNEIGVPKTLLELSEQHHYGVIEMGMRARGEIALLAKIAAPDVAVITNVGTAHIGRLGSEQAIADAKCELLEQLSPTGIAVLNHDNARLMKTAQGVWTGEQITFGLQGGDVQGNLLDADHIEVDGKILPLPLPGKHNAVNFLSVIAVMKAFGLDWSALQQGLAVSLPSGRGRRLTLPNDLVILDETYNAGVESMTAALHLLKETPGSRRIAVLGTMKELGNHSIALHQRVGKLVKDLQLDYLLTLADPNEADAMAASAAPVPTEKFANHTTLSAGLRALIKPGDRILFKASRSVQLDQVLTALEKSLIPEETSTSISE